ncbi:hypothetical protein GCM10009662_44150 [Catellatospora coxensis]|uniref:Uncharacterized protein n=1 Tax=Catellatospora coxensis TaxID=310354 RepID=A0A8J3L0S5_9ACTN|nr:hypothetical protein Cco03nite_23500 [Catellatospora coxensis]
MLAGEGETGADGCDAACGLCAGTAGGAAGSAPHAASEPITAAAATSRTVRCFMVTGSPGTAFEAGYRLPAAGVPYDCLTA